MSQPPPSTPKPPGTPPARQQNFQSTPISDQKLGSKDPDDRNNTRAHLNMFLVHDLGEKAKPEVGIEDFCTHILRTSTNAPPAALDFSSVTGLESYKDKFDFYAPPANLGRAKDIVSSRAFVELYDEYARQKDEKARYGPFVNLVNYILQKLRGDKESDGDLVFVRNDSQQLVGFQGYKRSPDVIGIRRRGIFFKNKLGKIEERSSNWNNKGPDRAPFHCREPLFFVEFEKEDNLTQETETSSYLSNSQTVVSSGKRKISDGPGTSASGSAKKSKNASQVASGTTFVDDIRSKKETNDTDIPKSGFDYQLKCADYAAGLFTYGGLRTFVFGMLILGNSLQLYRYGRSLIIPTKRFNFLADPIQLVVVLEGLMKLDDQEFGLSQALDFSTASRLDQDIFRGAELTLQVDNEDFKVKLSDKVYIQQALIGRGSFIARSDTLRLHPKWEEDLKRLHTLMKGNAKVEFREVSRVIVKFNSVPTSRIPESVFIERAKEEAKRHGTKFLWVLFRLPLVLHWEKLESMDEPDLRAAFMVALCCDKSTVFELRASNVLIAEDLRAITEIDTPYELLRAYLDCVEAHKWLVEDQGILHRDISLGNLMFRIVVINGIVRKFGVLNDYDLAVDTNRKNPVPGHKQRTGTQPFMAVDLLKEDNERHWPRHDIESFFYTYLYQILGYRHGIELDPHPIEKWRFLSREQLLETKSAFWGKSTLPKNYRLTDTFAPLQRTTINLFRLIRGGMVSWEEYQELWELDPKPIEELPSYNIKTLDGHVTHTKFIEVLSAGLTSLEESGLADGFIVEEPHAVQYDKGSPAYDEEDCDPDNDKIVASAIRELRNREFVDSMMPLKKGQGRKLGSKQR